MKTLDNKNDGMTLIEVLFSQAVFTAFLAVFLATFGFVQKFLKGSEELNLSTMGVLIDHQYLYKEMDYISNIISQPAYLEEDLDKMIKNCTRNPTVDWDLPGRKISVPNGYLICLKKTSFFEPKDNIDNDGNIIKTSLKKLLEGEKPGIYVLLSLPENISSSSIPARRIFCRPSPFCVN
tara:strand:- start:371 stop:907 length:537 start_codon:yes stop_codon:yes gene_type:complete